VDSVLKLAFTGLEFLVARCCSSRQDPLDYKLSSYQVDIGYLRKHCVVLYTSRWWDTGSHGQPWRPGCDASAKEVARLSVQGWPWLNMSIIVHTDGV